MASSRLILKTWVENNQDQHEIYHDLRKAIAAPKPEEKFFLLKKLDNIDQLRKMPEHEMLHINH